MKKPKSPIVLILLVLCLAGLLLAPVETAFGADADTKPVKRNGKPEDITYDDLKTEIGMDDKWDPSYATERVKELDGKTVRLRGFMMPGFQTKGITQFVMLKNTECKFGAGGEAHHCVMVHMAPDESARFTVRVVEVEGVLLLKPWEGPDGNTWALYEMRDAVVK
jgi:hypothetical protein